MRAGSGSIHSHRVGSVTSGGRAVRKKYSVFDSSFGEEQEVRESAVEVVDLEEEGDDEVDRAVRKSLAEARAVLKFQANEERIEREAVKIAKMEVEAKERAVEQEERRKRLDREKEEEDRKQREKQRQTGGTPIELKVQAKGGKSVKMRIRRSDPLVKVVEPFCQRFGLHKGNAVLMVDGEEVGKDETPDEYELEDGMVVEVVIKGV